MFTNIFNVTQGINHYNFSDLLTNNDDGFLWLSKLLFYLRTIDFSDFKNMREKNLIDKSSKIIMKEIFVHPTCKQNFLKK